MFGPGRNAVCPYVSVRAGQRADRAERRLRRVEAEPEILVGVSREHVGRLMPLRIPAAADLRAALVLAQADRRRRDPETVPSRCWSCAADRRRIVGRVLLVGRVEHPGELLRLRRPSSTSTWNSMLTSASGRCSRAHRAVGARHAVVEHHHVVLDHAEPFRLRILAGSGRVFLALQRLRAARRRRARRSSPGLLVVPEREADRAIGLHVGLLNMRASSMTSAVPEPSSFAASPQPWPSMWPPTMYISSGWVVPTLVQ